MPGKTRCLELGPIPEVPIRYQDETRPGDWRGPAQVADWDAI